MKVTKSTVEKMTITEVPNLDAVAVMVENFGPGAGKITITCFGEAWSGYWGAMGEQNTMATFFCKCDKHYLANKLKTGIKSEIDDEEEGALRTALRTQIIKNRRSGGLTHEKARVHWSVADLPTDAYGRPDPDVFYEIFGDEWYLHLPKKPNPDYEYLCQIIEATQAAFKQGEQK